MGIVVVVVVSDVTVVVVVSDVAVVENTGSLVCAGLDRSGLPFLFVGGNAGTHG